MITIYGSMLCPFCVKAVQLCEEQGEKFTFHPVNLQIKDILANKYNHTTVPIIFIDRKFVGGYDELRKKLTVHNTWEKIKWWIVTGYHFFHCSQTYRTRINARTACQIKYLSGKGK